jgi:hypothetical protein
VTWNGEENENENEEEDEEEPTDEVYETVIKAWHVIKLNKMNLYQERILLLTDKAYWTFKYDFNSGKVDEKHFKRHDLLDFSVCDIGDFDKIGEVSIKALKIFTHERRKNSVFGKLKEVDAINNKTGKIIYKKREGNWHQIIKKFNQLERVSNWGFGHVQKFGGDSKL